LLIISEVLVKRLGGKETFLCFLMPKIIPKKEIKKMYINFSCKQICFNLSLLFLLCVFNIESQAQRIIKFRQADATVNCYNGRVKTVFETDSEWNTPLSFKSNKDVLDELINVAENTDLKQDIYPIAVNNNINAAACFSDSGLYLIIFNKDWLLNINKSNIWASRAILAHELGHFLNADIFKATGSNPEIELKADFFAGETLAKMGASLEDTLAAYRTPEMKNSRGGGTHPPIDQRLASVKAGWESRAVATAKLPGNVDLELVWIKPGTVKTDDGRLITIQNGYFIGKYELTQEQWNSIVKKDTCKKTGYRNVGSRFPACGMDWWAANKYVELLSSANSEYTFYLPTHDEWEYAARGGAESVYSWGNDLSLICRFEKILPCDAGNSFHSEVGKFEPNKFGLYDTGGNVAEWVSDPGWVRSAGFEWGAGASALSRRVNRGKDYGHNIGFRVVARRK
jgi:hypothetical protein